MVTVAICEIIYGKLGSNCCVITVIFSTNGNYEQAMKTNTLLVHMFGACCTISGAATGVRALPADFKDIYSVRELILLQTYFLFIKMFKRQYYQV